MHLCTLSIVVCWLVVVLLWSVRLYIALRLPVHGSETLLSDSHLQYIGGASVSCVSDVSPTVVCVRSTVARLSSSCCCVALSSAPAVVLSESVRKQARMHVTVCLFHCVSSQHVDILQIDSKRKRTASRIQSTRYRPPSSIYRITHFIPGVYH